MAADTHHLHPQGLERKKNIIVYLSMETIKKEHYEAPSTMVLEVKTEGIVCASQQDYNYGSLDEDD